MAVAVAAGTAACGAGTPTAATTTTPRSTTTAPAHHGADAVHECRGRRRHGRPTAVTSVGRRTSLGVPTVTATPTAAWTSPASRRRRLRRAPDLRRSGAGGHRERHRLRPVGHDRDGGVVGPSGHPGSGRRPALRGHQPHRRASPRPWSSTRPPVPSTPRPRPRANGTVGHEVFAISLATHAVLWSRDVDQPGWTAAAQLQRIALALVRRPCPGRLRRQRRRLRPVPRLGGGSAGIGDGAAPRLPGTDGTRGRHLGPGRRHGGRAPATSSWPPGTGAPAPDNPSTTATP